LLYFANYICINIDEKWYYYKGIVALRINHPFEMEVFEITELTCARGDGFTTEPSWAKHLSLTQIDPEEVNSHPSLLADKVATP
jgi:hypothetical protein